MAKMKIFCPHCGQPLQCDENCQGRQVRCAQCGQLFLVPQMSQHATLNEAAKVQFSDADIVFWKDFYENYPDLPPHESVVDAVTVKLKASGYKGSREEVFETIAKAARQELARQQQAPPIVGAEQSAPTTTLSPNSPQEGEWRRPTPEELEEDFRKQQQRWLEQDRRDEYEYTKVFLFFWIFGLVVCLIDQATTAALSWFLAFPIAWWIYRKIKKHYTD